MTIPDDLFDSPAAPRPGAAPARKCYRHLWATEPVFTNVGYELHTYCERCGQTRDAALAKRGRNNRARGNAAELDVARSVGGRKVGPLGHPWDVEMPGYARLQVRKHANPQGLRKIALELARIGSGAEMPGYVWIEPGRGGEQLIVFRLKDFAERHGIEVPE